MRDLIAALGIVLLAACSQAAPPTDEIGAEVDPAVAAAVRQLRPDVIITGGALDPEDGEYEVQATMQGGVPVEFDLVQTDGVWRVTQVQRDIVWDDAPEAVRAAFAASPAPFTPARVIESADPADGAIYYQLFSPSDQPGHPSAQVRWLNGEAAVVPPAH